MRLAKAHRTIERRIRINRRGGGSARCSGSRARVQPRKFLSTHAAVYNIFNHQAIWLYLRFTLSLRDVEDLLAERRVA